MPRYTPKHGAPRRRTVPAVVGKPLVGLGVAGFLVAGSGAAVAFGDEDLVGAARVDDAPVARPAAAGRSVESVLLDRSAGTASRGAARVAQVPSPQIQRAQLVEGSTAARNTALGRTTAIADETKAKAKRSVEAEAEATGSETTGQQAGAPTSKASTSQTASAAAERIAAIQADPKPYAVEIMHEAGFDDGQWACLESLWIGESDWRWDATNASSGAYGIPQSLPAEKMAAAGPDWRTNPETQMRWGIQYIKDAYGSPCNAWNAWNSRNPHWY